MKVIVSRGVGDNASPDIIVDPLCTIQHIGINRGKTFLYDQGFDKLLYSIEFKIPREFICGDIIDFYDPDYGLEVRGRIIDWAQSCSAQNDGSMSYSQTLIVEKSVV